MLNAGQLWDLYRLDLATLAWEEIQTAADEARMGPPRIFFGMAAAGDALYVFGGSTGMSASPLQIVKKLSLNDLYKVSMAWLPLWCTRFFAITIESTNEFIN